MCISTVYVCGAPGEDTMRSVKFCKIIWSPGLVSLFMTVLYCVVYAVC